MRIETEVALSYLKSGLSVLPAERQKKRPIGAWRMYAERLPTEIEVEAWFANNPDGVCLVCGKVSGNLECMDFDAHGECFKAWAEKLEQTLFDKLVIERTSSGGYHVLYRATESIEGNRKLAQGVRDGKKTTLIETRGEGGLFLCAPTEGYRLLQGAFTNMPTLSQDNLAGIMSQCESVSPNASPKKTGLEAVSITDLVAHHPSLRPVLIEDFLRLGETMNVIAPPKAGKSWLVIDLALAVATGRSWFGHPCTKGKV